MKTMAKNIKIVAFQEDSLLSLVDSINNWLSRYPYETIHDIKYSYAYCEPLLFPNNYSAMIIYTPEVK